MAVQRCPECGGRLNSNYCDICMRKVPFAGSRPRKHRDPWDYSSSHREEDGHKCITFDTPKTTATRQTITKPKTTFSKPKTKKKANPKAATVMAIVLALVSLLPTVFSALEDIHVDNNPQYDVEAFAPEAELPVVEPIGLYSNGEISILADSLGLYYDEPAFSIIIDNFSDQDIDVLIEKVAVNGFMLDCSMMTEVNAGDSCQAFLTLYHYELEKADIKQIAWIDLRLRIYNRDNYEEIGYVETVRIETDITDSYAQAVDRSGLELYNDGSVSILAREFTVSDYGTGEIEVFMENLSGSDAMVAGSDILLNGQKAEGYLGYTLMPGTCAISRIYLSDLENLDITQPDQIREINLTLQVDYMQNWLILQTFSESVTFEPGAIK